MYRKVKKKIAASITNLDSPATKKKLIDISPAETREEIVEALSPAAIIPLDFYTLKKPKYALVKTKFPEVSVISSLDEYFIKKSKTNVVFFDFGRTKSKNVVFDEGGKTIINFSAQIFDEQKSITLKTKKIGETEKTEKISAANEQMNFDILEVENSDIKIEMGKPAKVELIKTKLKKDTPLEINFRPKNAATFGIFKKTILTDDLNALESLREFTEPDFSLPSESIDSINYLMNVPEITNYIDEQVPLVFEVNLTKASLNTGDFNTEDAIETTDYSSMFGLDEVQNDKTREIKDHSQLFGLNDNDVIDAVEIADHSELFGLRTDENTSSISIENYSDLFGLNIDESIKEVQLNDYSDLYGLNDHLKIKTIDYLKEFSKETAATTVSENKLELNDTEMPGKPEIYDMLEKSVHELPDESKVYDNIKLEEFDAVETRDILSDKKKDIEELPAVPLVTEIWADQYFSTPKIIFELTNIKDPKFERPKLFKVTFQDFDSTSIKLKEISNVALSSSVIKVNSNLVLSRQNLIEFKAAVKLEPDTTDKISEDVLNYYFQFLMQPSVELTKEEKAELLNGLYDYQIEGVDFLTMNERAILADDLGLGKTVQVITTLKILLRQRVIKKVLIVANKDETGNEELSDLSDTPVGWSGHIYRWANQFSLSLISGVKSKRKNKWNENSQINIIDYNSLLNDFKNGLLDEENLSSFDCLVFDEYDTLLANKDKYESYLPKLTSQFVWNLTSNNQNINLNETNSLMFGSGTESSGYSVLKRSQLSVANSLPLVVRNEKWISFDDEQNAAYAKALEEGRNQLENFLSTGNILRFQANVLFFLHKLNQLSNFVEGKDTSSKSEILMKYVRNIEQSKSQVIIYSNYDKQGTQQIENLLDSSKIKYAKFLAGMSSEELSKSAAKFSSDKSITVLLASFKSAGARKALPSAPYLINFDPIWSPTAQWQIEDTIISKFKGKSQDQFSLTVYNLRGETEIEKAILQTLGEKGFLERNLCDNIPAQTFNNILTDDEWKNIIGLKLKEDENTNKDTTDEKLKAVMDKLGKLKHEEIIGKISALFKSLGYKKIEQADDSSKDGIILTCKFDRNGIEQSAKINCALTDDTNLNSIKEFVHFQSSKSDIHRLIVISLYPLPENILDFKGQKVTFVDRELLAKYLLHFNAI